MNMIDEWQRTFKALHFELLDPTSQRMMKRCFYMGAMAYVSCMQDASKFAPLVSKLHYLTLLGEIRRELVKMADDYKKGNI